MALVACVLIAALLGWCGFTLFEEKITISVIKSVGKIDAYANDVYELVALSQLTPAERAEVLAVLSRIPGWVRQIATLQPVKKPFTPTPVIHPGLAFSACYHRAAVLAQKLTAGWRALVCRHGESWVNFIKFNPSNGVPPLHWSVRRLETPATGILVVVEYEGRTLPAGFAAAATLTGTATTISD